MIGEEVAKWPFILRVVLSPFLLLWFGARIYFSPCIVVGLQRTGRCCLGCLQRVFCGLDWTFTDKKFPANDDAIGEKLTNKFSLARVRVEWKRAVQLRPEEDEEPYHLFSNGVKPEDVKQGALGDCWLVPVMTTLAGTMPMAIKRIFVDKERSWRGKYRVRLYDPEKSVWTTITVDDIIPTRNGQPLFAKPNNRELWVVLLERAVAKHCGSYSAIARRYEGWGLKTLTGNNVFSYSRLKPHGEGALCRWRRYDFSFETSDSKGCPRSKGTEEFHESDDFWKVLVNYSNLKYAICVIISEAKKNEQRHDGLLEFHAYSIVKVFPRVEEKLIKIRNCWGKNGRWKGTEEPDIEKKDSDDDTFWMRWEDFREVWTEIIFCSRGADIDLALEIHEDLGCPGPCVGCLGGCFKYWCLCRGCKHVICPAKRMG